MTVPEVAEILLVEDNADDAELAIRALRKRGIAGPVRLAKDGAEALEFLFGLGPNGADVDVRKPRVVFLDLKLPKVSGLDVLRRLRQDETMKAIPVVVLTSSQEEADVREAYLSGANSYVVKPVEFESFMEAVGSMGHYWLVLNEAPAR